MLVFGVKLYHDKTVTTTTDLFMLKITIILQWKYLLYFIYLKVLVIIYLFIFRCLIFICLTGFVYILITVQNFKKLLHLK